MRREEGGGEGSGPPGRRKRPPLVSRAQAIDAAYDLIASEGSAGLSMRKLAGALHVSLPTVYTAVDSRETLIGELQVRLVAEIAGAVAVERLAEAGTPLHAVAVDLLDWAERRPHLAQFLIVEPLSASLARRAAERATPEQRAAGRALLAGLARAGAPPDPVSALAYVFAEIRATLWLVAQEGLEGADRSTWRDIGCANVISGLSALATGGITRA